jgi:hypothetical protein
MSTRLRRAGSFLLLALSAILLYPPGSARAHPQLVGRWSAPVPPGGLMVYDFGPGQYGGNWVWRGPFTYIVNGCPLATGTYELQLFSGTEGTLKLLDTPVGTGAVGTINFAEREFIFKTVSFRP